MNMNMTMKLMGELNGWINKGESNKCGLINVKLMGELINAN